jgi:hypothetical protein
MDKATFLFQQDNARVNTTRRVMEFFEDENITLCNRLRIDMQGLAERNRRSKVVY